MKTLVRIYILALTITFSACDLTSTSSVLTFEPRSLAACDPASEVTVKWDTRSSNPDVHVVQIFINDGISEKLFAEGNSWGDARTGSWTRPGNPQFVLKDKASGKVIAQAAIGGPRCN